jgi:protein SCO1
MNLVDPTIVEPHPRVVERNNRCRFVALVVGALSIPACSVTSTTTGLPLRENPDIREPVSDFALTERSGKSLTKADLLGKVWIASFVFTRCNGTCPQVSATMARLQSELAHEQDVRLVTFTVDPARDDPQELRKYADIRRADRERWLFLTGNEKEIHRLLKESFKVPVARNMKATDPNQEFDHSTRLVVVDRQGRIRGYFQGIADPTQEDSSAALDADLRRLKDKVAQLLNETAP